MLLWPVEIHKDLNPGSCFAPLRVYYPLVCLLSFPCWWCPALCICEPWWIFKFCHFTQLSKWNQCLIVSEVSAVISQPIWSSDLFTKSDLFNIQQCWGSRASNLKLVYRHFGVFGIPSFWVLLWNISNLRPLLSFQQPEQTIHFSLSSGPDLYNTLCSSLRQKAITRLQLVQNPEGLTQFIYQWDADQVLLASQVSWKFRLVLRVVNLISKPVYSQRCSIDPSWLNLFLFLKESLLALYLFIQMLFCNCESLCKKVLKSDI